MKSIKKDWVANAAVGVAVACMPLLVSAENDISPSPDPVTPANWEVRQHAEMQATEVISRLAQGSFSTLCSDGSCGVFVEPLAGCVPGAKYPLLINSAKQVGVVPTQCTTIPGQKDGEVRYVVLLQQHKTLLKAMLDEIDLTIAFPTQAGQMNVLEIEMSGVRAILASLIPELAAETAGADGKARAKETSSRNNSGGLIAL